MARIHGGDAAVRDCSVRRRGRRARTAKRRGGVSSSISNVVRTARCLICCMEARRGQQRHQFVRGPGCCGYGVGRWRRAVFER